MEYISDTQRTAMKMVDALVDYFGEEYWFTLCELPNITLHTPKALVEKGYLERMVKNTVTYYRRMKVMED